MTNFNYNYNIPAANNNPSADQPLMLENYQSIHDWTEVDHVGYEVNNGGFHKQVTFNNTATPAAQTDPVSVAYTTNDVAGHPNLFFKNSQAAFMLSCVKAFGVFTTTNTASTVTALNSYNINTTISVSGSLYAITLNSNVVTGNNVIVVLGTSSTTVNPTYSFSGGVLTIRSNTVRQNISFLVLQA
jgi:hypothetical protein